MSWPEKIDDAISQKLELFRDTHTYFQVYKLLHTYFQDVSHSFYHLQ